MDREGKPKPYALIEPGGVKIQRTRPGAVWMIAEVEEKGRTVGLFYRTRSAGPGGCAEVMPLCLPAAIWRRGCRWGRGR